MSEICESNGPEKLPSHDIYLTPESVSIAALIDQLDKYLTWRKPEEKDCE